MFLKVKTKICQCPEDCENMEYITSISYAASDLYNRGVMNTKRDYLRNISKTVRINYKMLNTCTISMVYIYK